LSDTAACSGSRLTSSTSCSLLPRWYAATAP
jgi:hypothetical protein